MKVRYDFKQDAKACVPQTPCQRWFDYKRSSSLYFTDAHADGINNNVFCSFASQMNVILIVFYDADHRNLKSLDCYSHKILSDRKVQILVEKEKGLCLQPLCFYM